MKLSNIAFGTLALALGLAASAAPPSGVGRAGSMPSQAQIGMDHATTGSDARSAHQPSNTPSGGQRSVDDLLTQNTKLASQIKDLTGLEAQDACSGFSNLGACVAAAHVSKNLNIDFDTLRTKVTGDGAVSLGKAVHELQPDANANGEVRKAEGQANKDLHAPS